MNLNLLDESIFEVNKNFKVNIIEIGNSKNKLIEIENFLCHPEKFLNFLSLFPLQERIIEGQMPRGFFPGYQTYLTYNFGEIEKCLRFIMSKEYGYEPKYINFSYQLIDGNKKIYNQSNYPHCDELCIAGNLFLNTSNEIDGRSGTAFYRVKETSEEAFFPNKCSYRKLRYGFLTPDLSLKSFMPIETNEKYELYHLSEIKFNKLNIYEGALFHSPFIEPGRFKNNTRKSFSFVG